MVRAYGRSYDTLRPLSVIYNVASQAAGSVLIQLGRTKVLVAVSLQRGVPPFMRGKQTGWLTAEYAMMPAATKPRGLREGVSLTRSGRSQEIGRMIGRSLRSVARLDHFGEQTIHIDCDVVDADGSTRVAAIIGASLALRQAEAQWMGAGLIDAPVLRDDIVAVSIGVGPDGLLLDLDYQEDACIGADCTVVMTRAGDIVELHASAERSLITWDQLDAMRRLADVGRCAILKWYDTQADAHSSASLVRCDEGPRSVDGNY